MLNISKNIVTTLNNHHLCSQNTPLLLMVSGGSDSTVLAYIFKELQDKSNVGTVAAMHVNHKIRGEEADGDQAFVENLCEFLDFPLFTVEVNIPRIASQTGENIEACARRERYSSANDALASLCNHLDSPFKDGRIVTAHTLDDRIENFYMRSIVGTGPGGFRSMRYKSRNIIRPLLNFTKKELQNYICCLHENKLAYVNTNDELWREDSTNKDVHSFRAFVRHELMPLVQSRNPKHAHTLETSMDLIADEDDMLDEMAHEVLSKTITLFIEENRAIIDPSFAEAKLPLQRRCAFILLNAMMPESVRVENASVQAVLEPFSSGKCAHVSPKNIQCDLVVSSNKNGVTVEPCASYKAKRKKM